MLGAGKRARARGVEELLAWFFVPHVIPYPTTLQHFSVYWSVTLVGYAMIATIAGTYVAFDETNTSSHSGHDL